jgi:hypothetical protein
MLDRGDDRRQRKAEASRRHRARQTAGVAVLRVTVRPDRAEALLRRRDYFTTCGLASRNRTAKGSAFTASSVARMPNSKQ